MDVGQEGKDMKINGMNLTAGYAIDRKGLMDAGIDLVATGFGGGVATGLAEVHQPKDRRRKPVLNYVAAYAISDEAAITGFSVAKRYRRKGFATAILKAWMSGTRRLEVVDPSEAMLGAMRKAGRVVIKKDGRVFLHRRK